MLLLFTYYSAAGSVVKKGVFVFNVIPKMLRERKKSVMFSDMVVISKTTYKILIQNSLETTASKKIRCLKEI